MRDLFAIAKFLLTRLLISGEEDIEHVSNVHAKGGHFEYRLWTENVDFVHICYIQCDLFDCYIIIMESCQQSLSIHYCSFYKVEH